MTKTKFRFAVVWREEKPEILQCILDADGD